MSEASQPQVPAAPEAPNAPAEQLQTPETPQEPDTAELEQLRAERDELKKSLKQVEQKDMSEQQRELETLKEELQSLAKQKILDSKLFKEKELEEFDYKQLRAMGAVIDKLGTTGGKIAPSRNPNKDQKENKIVRGYKPDGKPYY